MARVTSCRYGVLASPDRTCCAGSNPAGGSNEPGRALMSVMRSSRNVRFWPMPGSAPVTYQRPEWVTSPYGCRVRSLRRPSPEVYLIEIGRRWRTASAIESRTSVSGVGVSPGGAVKARESSTASSLRASRAGQYPADLGRRRLGCRARGRHQPGPAARDQSEQHGEGLVVAEHERRQAVSGGEPVPAVAATHRLDRHAEVDQVVRVPPHRALIDGEPVGQLGHRPDAARLQKLQQRQNASSRPGHGQVSPGYRADCVRYFS